MTKIRKVFKCSGAGWFGRYLFSNCEKSESVRNCLTKSGLSNLRLRALRRGIWFKVLSRVERGLIDLVLMTVRKIRSTVLAKSLVLIVKKLWSTMEDSISRKTRSVGLPLARRLSQIAQRWGNELSSAWAHDLCFAKFLTICHTNQSVALGT